VSDHVVCYSLEPSCRTSYRSFGAGAYCRIFLGILLLFIRLTWSLHVFLCMYSNTGSVLHIVLFLQLSSCIFILYPPGCHLLLPHDKSVLITLIIVVEWTSWLGGPELWSTSRTGYLDKQRVRTALFWVITQRVLTVEDGTDRLYWNISKKSPLLAD
jgi:hypothetical protein